MNFWKFTIFLFSAINCSKLATALECYTCSSSHAGFSNALNNYERLNFFNNHHKTSLCLAEDEVCAKVIVNHDGMIWIHRSCNSYDICSRLHTVYNNQRDQLLDCITCMGNLCNDVATNSLGSTNISIIISILFIIFLTV